MEKPKYKLAKLNDKNGVISDNKKDRWYVEYHVFDYTKNKLIRKRNYKINNHPTRSERYSIFQKMKASIDRNLKEGYTIKEVYNRRIFETLDEMVFIKEKELRKRTFQAYKSTVSLYKKYMENEILTNVKVSDILNFRDFLCKKRKNITVNSCIRNLSTLLNEAQKRGYLTENPCKKVKKLKEEASFSNKAYPKEVQKRLIPKIKEDPKLWLAVRLLYYCFIRISEMNQIKISWIDLKNQHIFIPAFASKNGKSEHVTIPNHFAEQLKEEIKGRNPGEFLLTRNDGSLPLSKNVLGDRNRKVLEGLELKGQYTLYGWKHTGVVEAYKNGVDIKSIQLQCRHSSVGMTDIYLKSLGLYLNKAILQSMPTLES